MEVDRGNVVVRDRVEDFSRNLGEVLLGVA